MFWLGVLTGIALCWLFYVAYGWYQDAGIERRRSSREWCR